MFCFFLVYLLPFTQLLFYHLCGYNGQIQCVQKQVTQNQFLDEDIMDHPVTIILENLNSAANRTASLWICALIIRLI